MTYFYTKKSKKDDRHFNSIAFYFAVAHADDFATDCSSARYIGLSESWDLFLLFCKLLCFVTHEEIIQFDLKFLFNKCLQLYGTYSKIK